MAVFAASVTANVIWRKTSSRPRTNYFQFPWSTCDERTKVNAQQWAWNINYLVENNKLTLHLNLKYPRTILLLFHTSTFFFWTERTLIYRIMLFIMSSRVFLELSFRSCSWLGWKKEKSCNAAQGEIRHLNTNGQKTKEKRLKRQMEKFTLVKTSQRFSI